MDRLLFCELKGARMKKEVITGTIQGNERGYAFLIPEDKNKNDYFIPHSDLRGAMHGDIVLCETTDGVGDRTTARVLKIIERGITEVVGTFFTCKSGGFVSPDDKKYFVDIFIPHGKGLHANAGDKVVCKILSYPKKGSPEGIISKIFGKQFNKDAELKSILYNYKLSDKFPREVKDEAEQITATISKSQLSKRKDFRKELTFTIDGEDAKDFDDAVSLKKKGKFYMLGVHIADVSEYVKPSTAIDDEAFERGTSVYFPEKVIPMLPEKLCNDVCSLRENEDRLTLSCIMKIDSDGKVIDSEITPAVIKSKKRFTYTAVQKILDGDDSIIKQNKPFYKNLVLMKELADILKNKRYKNGSIDLDSADSVISVNNGKIDVFRAKRDDAHDLIEQFMITANCTVAEYFSYLEIPFVYRVHDKPEAERLERFYEFLDGIGVTYKRRRDEIFPKDFQTILKNAEGLDCYPLINRIMLRTMQKAKYSTDSLGHFGLCEKFYCHFTSPIRRYPDLAIHRIIKDFLKNGEEDLQGKYDIFTEEVSKKSSEREIVAEDAERAVDDYYKALYIDNYIGCEFDGVISGVLNSGLFVELDSGVEGFVKVETLDGRHYECNKKAFTLSNGQYTYKLGEKVKIKVVGVNIIDKKAEFILTDKNSCKKKGKVVK